MIVNHFKVYGQIGTYIIRTPDPTTLDRLPEEKKKSILSYKYAFICYKEFDSASKAVNKISYEKLKNKDFNKELYAIVEALQKLKLKQENLYRCACFIIENCDGYKTSYTNETKLKEFVAHFDKHMLENDNAYVVKDKTDRLECCQ
jgi:hypothetical protein